VLSRGRGQEALRYRYDVVRLWQEPPERVLATPEAWAWPLAALMAGATAETVAAVAERIAQSPLPYSERGELTGLLAALAGVRLPRSVVEELLWRNPMIRDLLAESSVAEILLEEGEAKGRAEGKAEGQRELVQTMLESRFGALEPAEAAALRTAEEPALRALAAHITTDTRDQARARLGLA